MPAEDEAEKLLRVLRKKRSEAVEQIASGTVSAENVQGGYREVTGRINGFDEAIEAVLDVFKGWFPENHRSPTGPSRPPKSEY